MEIIDKKINVIDEELQKHNVSRDFIIMVRNTETLDLKANKHSEKVRKAEQAKLNPGESPL